MLTKEKLAKQGISIEFSQAREFGEKDMKDAAATIDGQFIVAVDDSTVSTGKSSSLAHLFTIARHYRCSLVLFWHSLFSATPQGRLISLNTAYFFLLSSPRMIQQIGNLGTQLNNRKTLLSAYSDACQTPYGYVLLDANVRTPHFLRIRSRVFDHEKPEIVYVPAV